MTTVISYNGCETFGYRNALCLRQLGVSKTNLLSKQNSRIQWLILYSAHISEKENERSER